MQPQSQSQSQSQPQPQPQPQSQPQSQTQTQLNNTIIPEENIIKRKIQRKTQINNSKFKSIDETEL